MTEENKASIDPLLKFPDIHRITTLSRQSVNRLEGEGKFPKRVQVGSRGIAWRESQIKIWVEERKTKKTKVAA